MENCKGCLNKSGCVYNDYSTICPCVACLIKVVCEEVCGKFIDFQLNTKGYCYSYKHKLTLSKIRETV